MSTNKLEYDSTLGGHVTLPTHVSTFRYAANVAQEMRQLIEEVRNPASRKLVFQTLPKHMRRRAMSHHPKRLPRKYRAAHRSQIDKVASKPKEQRCLQFMTKNLAFQRIMLYRNPITNIELRDLKDAMNRFRLTRHLSQSVLNKAFKPKSLKEHTRNTWLHTLLEENSDFQSTHENQIEFWQNCIELRSPGELLSNMILSLNVEDPQLTTSQTNLDFILTMPENSAHSPLWNDDIRNGLCKSMIKPSDYSQLRAKHAAVPGVRCQFEDEMQAVPVMLIQRPGSQRSQYKRLGYGCGWDIISPAMEYTRAVH
ncbi:ribonucleases P/MRP protein subunit POP1-like [Eurosta solidaginis]|uniref:ribonucleases P/MRP protein subunit POP1-like n=1 Tax=Eurosta solidaginis TaxID=178769 RepID=UPI003530BBD2